ncbi:MAG: hypothetical protein EZS26_001044 [Candidatus Ordinivivax streblomastigis]|uniref:Uncharacterized protein n=1 Tax=Candidatus Ordinivivax streblomastigis TaxID=2540710 RepID=A0A5M8P3A3_9BACT|nr:MAG: hypothetical protein EZS26_001044 [Candidatus Ordinivivax streblomastigis]
MESETKKTSNNSQRMIGEAIRKIALGRSIERIEMSSIGTGGVGTARMIHGYVAKIHDDTSDEFEEYGGTIDVGEFPDETASSEPVIHKGVLLSGVKDNSGGFLIIPTLFSDVTIVMDAATKYMYVLNYSHADIIQLNAHKEVTIGVTETEALDPEDNNSPDYDELEKTGNETVTKYTATSVDTLVKNKDGKEASVNITPESITQKVDKSEINQTTNKLEHKVGGTTVTIEDKKITLGEATATEPLVLGNQLAQLMLEFLTECTKIMTPTLMGTMPAVNAPNFASLISKIQNFLSQTAFTK